MTKTLCLILILFAQSLFANKKTVCSMTINSNHEIELFKKHLPATDWNFIELVPGPADVVNQNWLAESCQKKITCDILVISGHFGGTFFGSSKYKLPIQDLETKSCDENCSGILHQPKEVFLFGCNTLATKQKDHRSPEEYLQILIADGFSASQASQIVSFRYSGFGDTFQSRMSQVFAKTPNVYGFSSVGPSGKTVEPLLNSYLLSSQNEYKNFDLTKSIPKQNVKLFSSLKATSLAQTKGSLLNLKSAEEKPYCYLKSSRMNHLSKLRYIEKLFAENKAMGLLDHIQTYLHPVIADLKSLSADELSVLKSLSTNLKIKSDLLSLLQLQGDVYIPLKANVIQTLNDLKFINDEYMAASFQTLLDLNKVFTNQKKDMLCSLQLTMNIPAQSIPVARWNEMNFLVSMLCLKPKDIAIQNKFVEIMQTHSDPAIRGTAVWFFNSIQSHDEFILQKISDVMKNDPDESVRASARLVLKTIKKK
jgi:hypothetical protein